METPNIQLYGFSLSQVAPNPWKYLSPSSKVPSVASGGGVGVGETPGFEGKGPGFETFFTFLSESLSPHPKKETLPALQVY